MFTYFIFNVCLFTLYTLTKNEIFFFEFMMLFIKHLLLLDVNPEDITVYYQRYDREKGITDIEITDNDRFHLIVEAKLGWNLPTMKQLELYSERKEFKKRSFCHKMIVSMSYLHTRVPLPLFF